MILRPAGSSPAFAHPPTSHARTKLSPQAMSAIVMSLAFHGCVAAYLFAYHFTALTLPAPPEDPPVTFKTVTLLPKPAPPPPIAHEKPQPQRQPRQAPIQIHDAPRLLNLDPGPTLEAPLGPQGPGGQGQGFGEDAAAPSVPVPQAQPKPKVIANPDWISKPTGTQLADAYPDRPLSLGIAGSATLLCTVGVNGQVRACTVAEETPKNMGFGAAALRLSRWFKIRPETQDGQAVDGAVVRVPMRFGVG